MIYPRATQNCSCATCVWLRKTETLAYSRARSGSLLERLMASRDTNVSLGEGLPVTPTSFPRTE
jgi:hypothetical protein